MSANLPNNLRIVSSERQPLLAAGGDGPHDPGMEARVAVLEQIAKETRDAIVDLRAEMRGLRTEMGGLRSDVTTEMNGLRSDARSDYRWLLGIMLGGFAAGFGLLSHGFHWW